MTTDDKIVRLEGLTHRYGAFPALDGVSFEVRRATLFGLLGPNGCGKTTLFRILSTLLTPSAGSAQIAGHDVVRERNLVLSRIGVVFQRPGLDGKLTAWENLRHQGLLYGMSGRELKTRGMELLGRLGVAERAHHRVETLSGGLQRRVELAKVLLHRPDILILDEPSTGLDPAARKRLLEILMELRDRDGVTCLLTTHLMDEADQCDCAAILDGGKLVALDQPVQLKKTVGGNVVTVHSSDPLQLSSDVRERFGLPCTVVGDAVRVEHERGHELVPKLIEAFPGKIDGISVGKPTLNDVFLRLTGHQLDEPAPETVASGKG